MAPDSARDKLSAGTALNAVSFPPLSRLTAGLMVVAVLGFLLPFGYLLVGLHFTDQPAAVSFDLFHHNSGAISLAYYLLALDGLLVMFVVVLLYRLLAGRTNLTLLVAALSGVVGGLMQAIGDLRWPFLLPTLTHAYFASDVTPVAQQSLSFIFQAVDQLLGVVLSEHLYYLFMGLWTLLIGWHLTRSVLVTPWLGWLGYGTGIAFLVCSVEQFDLPTVAGTVLLVVVLLSRITWSIWMLLLATSVFRATATSDAVASR